MIIAGIYSFNSGEDIITSRYPTELEEVKQVISAQKPVGKKPCLVEHSIALVL